MSDESKLKPCPFCGGDELPVESDTGCGAYVRCPKCTTMGPSADNDIEAVQRWNERYDEKEATK